MFMMIWTKIMEKQFVVLDKSIGYNGFFKLMRYTVKHTLFAGGWSADMPREVLERGHAVAVLPYDPVRDEVVLVEQFRAGAISVAKTPDEAWLLEVVAGIIEVGEQPLEVVHRETREEAGCEISDLIPLYHFFGSPGGAAETTQLFCGRVDSSQIGGVYGIAEEHEDIQVHVVSFAESQRLLAEGKIRAAPAVIALQWLALNRESLRQHWLAV
jgi:ADP-ribose pyrophosphatase